MSCYLRTHLSSHPRKLGVARLNGQRTSEPNRRPSSGTDYRRAAEAVGYRSPKDLHSWAKRAGLLEVQSRELLAGYTGASRA